MPYNGLGINEGGMVNGAMSRKVEITLNSAVSLVQTLQPLLFIPCYKIVCKATTTTEMRKHSWCLTQCENTTVNIALQISYNGSHIPEGGDYEALNFQLSNE